VSGSRDKTIKLWNTLGECKYTIGEPDGHTEWVSCVRFSPVTQNPIIVSAGWDKAVKVRPRSEAGKRGWQGCLGTLAQRPARLRYRRLVVPVLWHLPGAGPVCLPLVFVSTQTNCLASLY
jgi:hypothetical protein